ncbi:MAG: ATP-binding protein [Bacteroidetes bacterium]|nr:ATP-binding protein [Bacteroidota bacterium]
MSLSHRALALAATSEDLGWLKEHMEALSVFNIEIIFGTDLSRLELLDSNVVILDSSIGLDGIHTFLADAHFSNPHLPIVVSVAESQMAEMDHLIRYGAQDFILKDVDKPAAIRRSIVNAIDRAAALKVSAQAEAQIRTLVESLSDGILIVDSAGIVLYGNPIIEELLGRPLDQLYGLQTPFQVTGQAYENLFWERANQPPITLSVHSSSIRWDGLDAVLLTFRDVTIEQASYEMLKLAKKTAEKAGAMKSTFLAHMSHELRLPLASIIGFAQLIEEGETNKDFKEFAHLIEESGHRLLETINSVLEAARLEQHTLLPTISNIDLATMIPSVIKRLQPLVRQPSVAISSFGPPSLPVLGDRNFTERILTNLIGNAAKFTTEGRIHVSWEKSETEAIVKVIDTGIGIDSAFLSEAFEPFTQESSGSGRNYEGTGLGLAISKKLVETMNGSISVQSKKNEGATFIFTLPLAP